MNNSSELAPKFSVAEAVDILKNAEKGEHILLLYSDLNALREVYSKVTRYELSHPDRVVMLMPFYEGADEVKRYLQEGGLNVEKSQRECSLVVADALKWFFYSGLNVK